VSLNQIPTCYGRRGRARLGSARAATALNIGLLGVAHEFDPYPFGLLTMVVSLEAIFLATFVMVSQNRQAARSDIRSQVDFESNLSSLIWLVHLADKLDIDIVHVETLCAQAIQESRTGMTTPQ